MAERGIHFKKLSTSEYRPFDFLQQPGINKTYSLIGLYPAFLVYGAEAKMYKNICGHYCITILHGQTVSWNSYRRT